MSSNEIEQMVSELDIFAPSVTQSSVLSGDYQHFKPVQSIVNDSPITFQIGGNSEQYVDMDKTLLYVRMRIIDSTTNTAFPAATVDYSVVNNLLNSLFSDVKLELNQTTVSSSNSMNHYRAYIETLFNFNQTAKETHLTAPLFIMDDADGFTSLISQAHIKRKKYIKDSKVVELVGKLHTNFVNSGRYLLNQIDMRYTLTRNPASLVVVAADGVTPRLELQDATLLVRKINISPSIMLAHAKILGTTTAKYNYKRVELQNFTLSSGIFQRTIENMFLNKIPSRIIFGLVKNSAYSGALKENCFNFENFDVSQITLSINGKIVGSTPYKLNYGENSYMLPYIFSFINCGIPLNDDGYCVGRDAFKGGYSLYCYDLTPNLSANESYTSPPVQGNCRLELTFATALPCVVNLIVLSETPDVAEIDRNREISIQYKN
jgi:hypothetical protein